MKTRDVLTIVLTIVVLSIVTVASCTQTAHDQGNQAVAATATPRTTRTVRFEELVVVGSGEDARSFEDCRQPATGSTFSCTRYVKLLGVEGIAARIEIARAGGGYDHVEIVQGDNPDRGPLDLTNALQAAGWERRSSPRGIYSQLQDVYRKPGEQVEFRQYRAGPVEIWPALRD